MSNSQTHKHRQYTKVITNHNLGGCGQRGAVLIVVLLFLVLITIAGLMAVRKSGTDLKLATADQINTTLLQSSDSGNQKLEQMVNGKSDSQAYKDITSMSGAFGHFILSEDNHNNEYIYCFNPRSQQYLANNSTITVAGGGYWNGLNRGYCDYTKPQSYTSQRATVMTQMNVSVTPTPANAEAFAHVVEGKDSENRSSKKYRFDIRSTSTLPAYAEPKSGSDKCYEKSAIKASGDTPLLKCLQDASTPNVMLYEQADVMNISSATECIGFGQGSASLATGCVLS